MKEHIRIKICNGDSCKGKGAFQIFDELKKIYDSKDISYCKCLNACDYAPTIEVNSVLLKNVKLGLAKNFINYEINFQENPNKKEKSLDDVLNDEFIIRE